MSRALKISVDVEKVRLTAAIRKSGRQITAVTVAVPRGRAWSSRDPADGHYIYEIPASTGRDFVTKLETITVMSAGTVAWVPTIPGSLAPLPPQAGGLGLFSWQL